MSAGDTAWAVLALSAIGVGGDERDAALEVLLGSVGAGSVRRAAAAGASDEAPGLLALAALAVVSADGSPTTVAGLVSRVGATMRTAPASVAPTGSPTSAPSPTGTSNGGLAPSGASPLTPGLAGTGVLLVLLGTVAVAWSRRRGSHA